MAITQLERQRLEHLTIKLKTNQPLAVGEFEEYFVLKNKSDEVDFTNEQYNYQVVDKLLDQHALHLNSKVVEMIQVELKNLGYGFSTEAEFIAFCKQNIKRERVTKPYPADITSYFLVLKNQNRMPRKLLSVVYQFGMDPERGVVSYSIETYS